MGSPRANKIGKIKKMKEKIAFLISLVFGPPVTTPLLFFLALFREELSSEQMATNLFLVVLVDLFFPWLVLIFFLKKKWISDWEVSRLGERFVFFMMIVLFGLIGASSFYFWGSQLLFKLHLILITAFLAATVISLFWKISIHLLVDTALISLLAGLFPNLHFLYLFLPVIAWSRFVRHKHTPGQLLGGFLLAIAVVLAGMNFLSS